MWNFQLEVYKAVELINHRGVHVTFIDDQLNRGDEISESLVNAIEASDISVIVFSESYASSRWCLDELVKILDCKKEYAQIVIPVFYRVDPSDVRNRTGSFGDSFSKLAERLKVNTEELRSWRNALKEAATLSGFHSLNMRLSRMKVLIVFDDVTCFSQLESLIGSLDGLTPVCRIIITTRNKQVLRNWGVRKIYEMGPLEYHHALELFSRHAFKRNHPDVGYEKLSSKVMNSSFNGENKCKVSYLQDPGFAEVKYFYWHGYPLKSLPSNLNAEKLLFLEVPGSDIEQLCDGVKLIAKIPNPTLISHPNKLVILNLKDSKSLKSLPARIFNLEFLTKLDLSGCSKLKKLPEISSSNISRLYLSGTAIEELPSSFELLLRLWWLDLSDCKMLKSLPSILCKLKSLGVLNLRGCSNLRRLPERNSTAGTIEDAMRIEHMGHVVAARWKEVREKRSFPMEKSHVVLARNEIPRWFNFQSEGSFITLEMPPDFFNNNRVLGFAFSAILAFSDRHVDCGRWFSFSFELKVKTTKDCDLHDTRLFQSRVNYVESDHLHFGYYLFCEEDFNGFWKCNSIPEAVHFNVFPPLKCECCGVKKCGIHLVCFPDSTNSMEDPSTCFNYNEED
ncbi:ADP-ribosyl cyclase/cyclic ADP-ribose hydrolase [Citrus sinensis]|nr:ADP-ribosyl cyclase/cyclic ADP-ribose hydrolase [Citrus sinensis]